MRLLITSGQNKSHAAIALCELLHRSGHKIDTVFIVTPFSIKRLKSLIKQRGFHGFKQALIKLLPLKNKLLSENNNLWKKYFEENSIHYKSLKKWCRSKKANYLVVDDLNSKKSLFNLNKIDPDAVIYSGGGILKSHFIKAAKERIINNHSGPLPEVRGLNAIEWSILLGYKTSITIHLIDKGIDTGRIISKKEISIDKESSIDDIRDKAVISGVKEIVKIFDGLEDFKSINIEPDLTMPIHRQCYFMSPAIREILSRKLKSDINV